MNENSVFLIVDDEVDVRQTLKDYLNSFGFTQVIEAEDGYEALNLVSRVEVDFVISDWEMPGINGLEFLKILRKDETTRHIPFIMITSPTSQERQKVLEAAVSQVDAYLIKPFRADMLKVKLEELQSRRRPESPPRRAALVVDDDEGVRSTITDILESMGYSPVLQAKDGEEGFQVLKDHAEAVEIVVSDWEMPRLSGIELLRRVREDETVSQMPFVMVTSQTSIEHLKIQAAIKAEVDHYLMKPFSVADLRTKIETVLKRARLVKKVASRMDSAQSALNLGDFSTAERLLNHILELDPKSVDAYIGLAHVRLRRAPKKGFDEAITFLKRALELHPKVDRVHLELAKVYENAQSLDKSIQVTRRGIEECPMSDKLHFQLGRVQEKRGQTELALLALQRALELNAENPEARELLAALLGPKGPGG